MSFIQLLSIMTYIPAGLYYGCSGLVSIEIPDGVTRIEEAAFGNCENLKSIKIPDSVMIIGPKAFEACRSLTNIEIPSSVTALAREVFYGSGLAFEFNDSSLIISASAGFYADTWLNSMRNGVDEWYSYEDEWDSDEDDSDSYEDDSLL